MHSATRDAVIQLWSEAGLLRAPGGSYQVMIVEDEPDFRRLLELHLGSWRLPIHPRSVPSGFDALLQIGTSQSDLLITDLRMPGIDGVEMLRALRASGANGELEISIVTALSEHTIAERGGLPAGVTVLYKPLRIAELRQGLEPLIEHWQRAATG